MQTASMVTQHGTQQAFVTCLALVRLTCDCLLQAMRRVLANIPVNSQVLSSSPYLDVNLFKYDDRLVSPLIRPRVYAVDSIIRFVSRRQPDKAAFKMLRDCLEVPGRPAKQIIHYHFHPVLPFAMFYLLTFIAGPQICIYTRY